MKKKIFKNLILLMILLDSIFLPLILIPISGSRTNSNSQVSNMSDSDAISIDKEKLRLPDLSDQLYSSPSIYSLNQFPKFDQLLNTHINEKMSSESSLSEKMKVIITFEENTSKSDRIKTINSLFTTHEILKNYDIIDATYLTCDLKELIDVSPLLEGYTSIEMVYKSKTYSLPVITDDSLQTSELNSTDYSNWWLGTIGAKNLNYDGEGVRVAVLDSGIYNHPDLTVVDEYNFIIEDQTTEDLNGHGTHVAGIIGSDGGGSNGKYAGVAPGVELINARVADSTGAIYDSDVISAIEWCVESEDLGGGEADIISMSFGGGYPDPDDPMTKAISKAVEEGLMCVTSAGNSGPGYFTGSSPAAGIDAIAVGATDQSDRLASFSSWGPTFEYLGYPDVVAPGVNIISTEAPDSSISTEKRFIGDYFDFIMDADYIPLSGTSMSCPMVSGALAILKEAYPHLTPETARIALIEGCYDLPQASDDEYLKSGAGIVNVSESLKFLEELEKSKSDINNSAVIYPNELPFAPYDLLHFPGDYQELRLTVLSGRKNSYNISLPESIEGVTLSLDSNKLTFSDPNIGFFTLKIKINEDAEPGIRTFKIKLTGSSGSPTYDTATIRLDIRLPEYNVLMDTYHGLNDWLPEVSFHQMGFYEAMKDISLKDISIDYAMEYWNPNYDPDLNATILTQERIARYDLIILQNPILPYSPLEIENLKNYFNSGGNLLFLGTRYQDLCTENIDYLFSELDLGIEINSENLMDISWLGSGASIDNQPITELDSNIIFDNVTDFLWSFGNSFTTFENQSIASKDGLTVAAIYNQSSQNKGRFVAFGDLHWLYEDFNAQDYSKEHEKLLDNVMEYLLKEEGISINIKLNSERTHESRLNISVYVKNQGNDNPIQNSTLNTYLNITLLNSTYSEKIPFISKSHGIAYNYTYNLPHYSSEPYTIKVNLTYNSKIYEKTTKVLYYNLPDVPEIISLGVSKTNITRAKGQYAFISTKLDDTIYNVSAYLSIYSFSIFNNEKTVNKTLVLNPIDTEYDSKFDPSFSDPSGYAFFYIIPENPISNLINPNSPRDYFWIKNNNPELIDSNSTFQIGNDNPLYFNDTIQGDTINIYSVTNGTGILFKVDINETVSYEQKQKSMRVLINLYNILITQDNYLMIIYPTIRSMESFELKFNSTTDSHEGNFTIPNEMLYDSISGKKWVSTRTNFQNDGNVLAVLYVTVLDGEGGYDDHIILLTIDIEEPVEEIPLEDILMFIVILSIIIGAIVGGAVVVFLLYRKYKT